MAVQNVDVSKRRPKARLSIPQPLRQTATVLHPVWMAHRPITNQTLPVLVAVKLHPGQLPHQV